MQTELTRNGTDGRVYGGDCELVHIKDGQRKAMGALVALRLDQAMRRTAVENETRTTAEAGEQLLCPGCVMVALFNAAVILAEQNGQPLSELGNTMAQAFQLLADGGIAKIEEINVILD